MKTTKYIITLAFTVWCALGNLYAVTSEYYSSVNNKSGADLFNAVHSVAKTGYTSGLSYDGLWTVYCSIDLNSSGKVWDMYSNATSYTCGGSAEGANYSKEGDSYNREHSIPKSWFGGSKSANTPGTDLFHVVPTDGYVNNMRSAYAFGEVSSASYTSQSGCKKGTPKSISISNSILNKSGSSSQSCTASTVFEPMDEFKGDFARGYFGTMIKWANGDYQTFTTAEGAQIFNTAYDAAHYYGLTGYGVALLLKWHRQDPVSQKEIDRNNGIQTNQGNRNPFIDYPELVEYIWGEHSGETVTLSSLTPTFSGYTPPAATTYTVILSRNGVTEAISGLTGEYTLPAKNDEAAACTNWAFAGWSSSKVNETTTQPGYITSVLSASTVYAVYAKTESSGSAPHRATMGTTDDELTLTTTGVSGTSYSDWSGKTAGSDAVYAGNSAGGNSAIQLRSNNSNSGIVTTASGGKVAKVTVTWNSNSANGRTINIYGKNSAYSAATDLYNNSNQGTLLGTIVNGTSTELSVSGDYEYIGIRSNSGALYLDKITITWSTSGGGSTTTYTYDSDPSDCNCSGNLSTPAVTATPSDGTITLTWSDVTNATNGYTVTISKGTGYTTECGDVEVGDITHSGSTNTCVITGLVNGLSYTTSVVANATATICESVADEDTTTPVGCTAWDDPTFTYASYTLTAGGSATAAPTVGAGHGTRTFTSSDESVLTVASDGKVTPKSAGTATVTAHWTGADGYCPKDVTSSAFTVNGKVTVTFDKNDGSSTTTTQQVDYNTATALTANTFTRTGYTFQGWATEASGAKVYNDGASITITAATTLYAVWQVNSHNVSFSKPTGASNLTVNGVTTSPKSVNYGSTVTIVVTPAAHYSVGSVTADGDVSVTGSGSNWSFTMPDKDVAITVTMVEDTKYTVNWYVSGTPTEEVNYAGEALAGIDDPTIDCNDKVFVGWTSHSNYNSDDVPDDLFTSLSGLVMPSNNSTNYYAVFADEVTSGSGSAGWSETAITDLTSSDVFVIVGTNSSGSRALPNDATSASPTAESITISAGKITSAVADKLKWNILGNSSDGYTFYPNGDSESWLYSNTTASSSSNTNIRVGTGNRKVWLFDNDSHIVTNDTYTDRYLSLYSTTDFRGYTSSGTSETTFTFYKYSAGSSTTYTGYTTSCTAPTEVTVTFNANGGTGTMSDQVVDYNTATALTANTFTRTGYSFAGWATTADGSKAYDDQGSVTLTKNTTLYALWTKNSYNVSFTPTMTGQATVTVNGSSTSPQSVEFGGTVSIAITPDVAYTVSGVTVTGGVTPSGSGNNWSFNMPANDVTITVTLTTKPTYTIRFLNNGNEISKQTVISGETAVKPTNPTPCDEDYTFVGWWTAALAEDNEESHTWITDFTATQNQDYYAVFSYTDGEGGGNGTPEKATSISVGDEVILVYETGSMELSSFTTSSTIYGIGSAYTTTPSGSYSFTVVAGNADGSFAFERGGNYWNWSSGNSLSTSSSITNNSSWTVSFSNGNAIITNVSGTSRTIRWNASSPRFACYESGQSAVQLYKVGAGSTTYYTTAPICAACENKITLTKGTPENGSFTLDKDNGEYENCKSKGFVVTVSGITPDEDYEFDAITQTGIADGVTIDQEAKTVTYAQNVKGVSTINVTFRHKPQYTIKFYDNGSVISEQLVTINKSPVVPDDPEGCDEYEFVGWWTDELAEDNTATHTWVSSFIATENKNYYAVFRHSETNGAAGGSVTFNFADIASAEGWTSESNGHDNITISPVNIYVTKGTADFNGRWWSDNTWRIYNGNTVTISSSVGSVSEVTSTPSQTFSISDGVATLSPSSTIKFTEIVVTYGSGSTTYYTTDTDCRDCSIPTLSFAATTVNKFDGDAPFVNALTVSGNTMGATVSYTSSNPSKAEVSADGTVTINDAMSTEPVIITATLAKADDGVNCQKKVSASYTLNIYNKVTWLVNGTPCAAGSQTTQTTEGGTIVTAPIEPDGSDVCFGKTFVGWTTAEYEEDDTKPEILYTSSSIVGLHITESTTFYAVFAELTGTLNQYRKGTPTQLTTGRKVIIVNTAANKAMKAANSFKNGYDVTPVGDAFSTEEQTIVWTVEQVDGGGYYFMYDNKYLNAATTSLYLDGDEDAWTVTGAGPYIISSGKYPSYSLEWYGGEFKSYTTGSGDAFNMDLYFPNWTIGAYATTCGLCMPKPEVTSTIIKSDRVTITWKAVVNATGYEFTCSGGEVSVSGTTATITGLTPLSDYTYSIRAQGGAPYTCFRTTNGSFSTPDCDDMPYDITATPYNVVQAIIRWKAEAERGKVVVYNDEACTQTRVTIADTISPCYVSGLEENTRYWFKVFGGVSQDCESPVQTFLTQTTAVEIVEWQNDGVIILLTGDETTASVLIEDKQEHIENAGNVADKLFISKYFEADGNNKMIAVYNGTKETIDITNYWLKHSNKGSAETKICLKKFGKTPGQIAPNEEIIIMRFTTSKDPATECAEKEDNYDEWSIVNEGETDGEGNNIYNWLSNIAGPQSVGLYNGTTMIDLIGARTEGGALVQIKSSIKDPCSSAIAVNSANTDAAGFNSKGIERGTEDSVMLSTNRCLLIRKNTVKSGDNAVATNVYSAQEECSAEVTKAFKTLSDEWVGYVIGKDNASTRTCEGLAEVGGFDYQGYYASYDTAVVVQDLVQNADGTITIPIPELDTMSCTMLRINVYDKNTKEQKASREYRIPIMIQSGEVKSTNELFTKHGVAVCKECDVLVFNGATLKKDNVGEDRDSIGNLTLYPGSTLELPAGKGDYHVKSLTYRVEGDNVPATKLNGDLYSETQQLIVTRRINNDRYYFISFPYDVNVNEITLANGNKAVNGKDFRLLEYDAETRAQEGSLQGVPGHWKMLSGDKLLAGRGYAIAVNTKAMKEIMFPMTIPSKNLTNEERTKVTNTVDINEYVGAARNTNHNWNLIAHPYITKFEVSGAESVEAYWESPSRENTDWVDDWKTWDDPTQPTDSTHTQNPDSTGTQTDYIDRGTLNGGCIWVLYNDGTMELSGSGQVGEFSTTDDVPWKAHREKITSVKVIGEIQLINYYAFAQCTNLTNVTIAAPVSQINAQAFAACNQLTTIRIESSLSSPIIADGEVFDGIDPSKITLMVPQSLLTAYKNTTPWKNMSVKAISGSNTGNAPRRVDHPDGWTESPGGIYVTRPTVTDGKITYEQLWINAVTDIPPFTAMFIQGDGRGEMTFNMYPASPAPKRSARASRYETKDHTIFVGVSLHSTNGISDLTSLRLRPDFGEHYKFGQDLLKFTVFNTSRPQLYIKTPDDQLAFRAISDSLAEHSWIPVGVYCRDAGTYTFSLYDKYVLDEIEAVYLHDNVTGITTNLLYGNYKIETTKQLYTNTRFTLNVILRRKVEVDTPTVIEHTENPNAPRKFFRDGVMYIMRDGKIYDLTGKPAELDNLLLNR